jgi:hypothetical protein
VNYLSRFALTLKLLESLAAAGRPDRRSRILIVNGAAQNGRILFDDVNLARNFGTLRAILQCCQANDAFVVELADRLARAGEQRVGVTTLKVGVVATGIRRTFPWWMKILVPLVMDPLLALSPGDVAARGLQLLLDPRYENVTGAHFLLIRRFKAIAVPRTVRELNVRVRLWRLSEAMIAGTRRV